MRYISIDSSLAHTGIAVGSIINGVISVDEIVLNDTEKSKHKQVRASSDTIARCKQTYDFINDKIKEIRPDVIFVETPSGSQSASGMKSYGATCQLIATLHPQPIEVTPIEVKVATVGTKTASKREMIDWAYKKYPSLGWFWYQNKLQDKNEHMADAIAITYAGIKTGEFTRLQNIINNGKVL